MATFCNNTSSRGSNLESGHFKIRIWNCRSTNAEMVKANEARLPSKAPSKKFATLTTWMPGARTTTAAPSFMLESLVGAKHRLAFAVTCSAADPSAINNDQNILVRPIDDGCQCSVCVLAEPKQSTGIDPDDDWRLTCLDAIFYKTIDQIGGDVQFFKSNQTLQLHHEFDSSDFPIRSRSMCVSRTRAGKLSPNFNLAATFEKRITDKRFSNVLNWPFVQIFNRYSECSTDEIRILHNRELTSSFAKLGY